MSLVVVCGGSGMVGRELIALLRTAGTPFAVVGRDPVGLRGDFPDAERWMSWREFGEQDTSGFGTIVNLAGAGVAEQRWSPSYKNVMIASRLDSTAVCARLCAADPSIRLISASSIHAYGIYPGDHPAFTEADRDRRIGTCYLQQLIDDWEAATNPATEAGGSVTLLRLGVVLSMQGGALPPLAKPFRFFVGGRLGSGRQIVPWISLRDVARSIVFLIEHPELRGPVNIVAPNACSNAEFARALGHAMRRPSLLPLPSPMARLVLGELADELLLAGQRVVPARLLEVGFDFVDTQIGDCLDRLVREWRVSRARA
jgi:uncharacterized protein